MKARKTYHHGSLREALLEAAEKILRTEGLPALSLRAIAREAGVSHGSPAHHFQDLPGLLSDLAAIGFLRLGDYLKAALDRPGSMRDDTDRAYVSFAIENPAMFLLMFREERLDPTRRSLVEARMVTFGILGRINTVADTPPGETTANIAADEVLPVQPGSLEKVGAMTATWAFVHGFSVLAIEGRLTALEKLGPPGTDTMKLLDAALADLAGRRGQIKADPQFEKPSKRVTSSRSPRQRRGGRVTRS
jgi:AcrR family transcriptional regulator